MTVKTEIRTYTNRWLLVALCLTLSVACSDKTDQERIDLTEYFLHYPAIKETSRLTFHENEIRGSLKEGWARPKKKASPPFFWTSGTKSNLKIFFLERQTYTMRFWCRSTQLQNMSVELNDTPIASLDIERNKKFYQVSLPDENIQPGINIISFEHSPRGKGITGNSRLAFEQLHFSPIPKQPPPELNVNTSKKSILFSGPLGSSFLIRTYQNSTLYLRHQSEGPLTPEDKIIVKVQNFSGQSESQNIRLNSTSWNTEEIDLSGFKNQVLKITFIHLVQRGTVTKISSPFLVKGRLPPEQKQVLLIGLDGADWEIVDSMIKKGKLPHFERLIANGVSGRLRSVQPMYSPVIWTSIITGKTKEKHGISGFLDQQKRRKEIIPNSRLNRKCLTLWNILGSHGHLVGIVGPWVSWPAEIVHGYMITDRVYFENLSMTTFPLELKHIILERISRFAQQEDNPHLSSMLSGLQPGSTARRSPIQKNIKQEIMYLKQDQLKKTAGLFFNRIFHSDFFFLYLRGPDVTSHFFWKYFEPDDSVPEEEVKMYADIIPQNYIYQDHVLGEYLDNAGPEATVIVVSDHGMARKSYDPEVTFTKIHRLWEDVGIYRHILGSQLIDKGMVLTFRPEVFLNSVENLFSNLTLGKDGTPLFSTARLGERNTISLHLNNVFNLEDNLSVFYGEKKLSALNSYLSLKEISGAHSLHGILIMSGPGIKHDYNLKECSVLDVAPTILHLFGLPAAEDMDGGVLVDAFTSEFLENNPIRIIPSYELEIKSESLRPETLMIDKELEEQLKERLRSLGYIK